MGQKHTLDELYSWQALPLSIKISMTKQRIRDWVNYYGERGVYVSFSGGKDSTVLLHIARGMYQSLQACHVDTGLEFPEIRKFIKQFDNIDIIKPEMGFRKVVEEYGFPVISKEVSECVYGAKKYYMQHMNDNKFIQDGNVPVRLKMLLGIVEHKQDGVTSGEYSKMYNKSRWKFLLDAPFKISATCCKTMKKEPVHNYTKKTGRMPITAQMADESKLRTTKWLQYGCNMFDLKNPISNPMSFWTEQDVLLYIKTYNIPIASVYGDVVVDYEGMGQIEGQMSIADFMDADEKEKYKIDKPLLKTTGCDRTGCVFCGFGCHLEKGEGRFERLKRTHPKHYKAMANIKNSGINYFEAIDWINEHNGKGKIIKY